VQQGLTADLYREGGSVVDYALNGTHRGRITWPAAGLRGEMSIRAVLMGGCGGHHSIKATQSLDTVFNK
jgi:hypothetical protein